MAHNFDDALFDVFEEKRESWAEKCLEKDEESVQMYIHTLFVYLLL